MLTLELPDSDSLLALVIYGIPTNDHNHLHEAAIANAE